MKFFVTYSVFGLLASAMPTALPTEQDIVGSLLDGATKCGPVAVLFSRGTWEFGAQGLAVGSPFTTALQAVLPSGTVFWGNEYNNDVVGYLIGGSPSGSAKMKAKAQEFVEKCPGIKLVLGGYSQGAQVTHHALESANAKTKEAVKAVVLFGDPLKGKKIPGIANDRIRTVCATGDTICWGIPVITISHMAYGAVDSVSAAAWVRSKINT
jgi:cutinase